MSTVENEERPSARQRQIAVLVPEELVIAAKDRWDDLKAHPASLGRARRYGAACAIRAAVRVGLASLSRNSE